MPPKRTGVEVRRQHLWDPQWCIFRPHCYHPYADKNKKRDRECCHCGDTVLVEATWNQEKE